MIFKGLYVKKTLFYPPYATQEQKQVPITGDNYMQLDSHRLVDYSKFCDIYLVFEHEGKAFVWQSSGKYGKPVPYKNANYRYMPRYEKKVFVPRLMLPGFEFDGKKTENSTACIDRNCFPLDHIEKHYEPLVDVLRRSEIVNKVVTANNTRDRYSRDFDGVFELVAIMKSECGIPRALIRKSLRRTRRVTLGLNPNERKTSLTPGERTVSSYMLIGPEHRVWKDPDLRKFYKVYNSGIEEEMSAYRKELAENTEKVDVETSKGVVKVESFIMKFLEEHLSYVPQEFIRDYIDRSFKEKPTDLTTKTTDKGGK